MIHPPTLAAQAEALRATARVGDREVLLAEIPDAEQGKRIEVAAFCWQVMGKADFTRTDAVVGFGGGAVTDLAGFVAATWLRGVEVVQVPTTVLGMVDAAVGGKTGVNTAEGKNLVGAFWAPRAVVCDLDLLDSLSRNELVAGYAEVVKAGFIWAPEILDLIEADPEAAVDPRSAAFRRIDRARDRDEGARRRRGPPRGRACARSSTTATPSATPSSTPSATAGATAPRSRSAWSSPPSCRGSPDDCRMPPPSATATSSARSACRRPTAPGAWPQLLATMQRDKKSRGGMLRFIVLDDIATPTVLQAPDESLLFAAYQEVAGVTRRRRGRAASARTSGSSCGRCGWSRPRDPDAAIAFLETHDDVAARTDEFWRERDRDGRRRARSAAQFVADVDDELGREPRRCSIRATGQTRPSRPDRRRPPCRSSSASTCDPTHRGSGAVDAAARRRRRVGGRARARPICTSTSIATTTARRAPTADAGFAPTGETLHRADRTRDRDGAAAALTGGALGAADIVRG